MRLLLDTHTFLWWVSQDERLSSRARRTVANPRNDIFFSVVSAWEIVTKVDAGKLTLSDVPERYIPREVERNGFALLPLHLHHALEMAGLPRHHGDPFDRLLIAQALSEKLSLVSGDRAIAQYPAKVVW